MFSIAIAVLLSFSAQADITNVPAELKNTKEFVMSDWGNEAAALTDDGIVAWSGLSDIPVHKWSNPKMIRIGGILESSWTNICAVVDHKIHCWLSWNGGYYEKIYDVLDPDDYVINLRNFCVLKAGLITCPQADYYARQFPPDLKGVKQFALGRSSHYSYGCAVIEEGIRCWGVPPENVPTEINEPGFKSVSLGRDGMCGLKENSFKCWGWPSPKPREVSAPGLKKLYLFLFDELVYHDSQGVTATRAYNWDIPKDLGNPDFFAVSDKSMCAITGSKARCWKERPLH